MFAIRITDANSELIAALNNGVVPDVEHPVAHYLVCTGLDDEPARVMDVQEFRELIGTRDISADYTTVWNNL